MDARSRPLGQVLLKACRPETSWFAPARAATSETIALQPGAPAARPACPGARCPATSTEAAAPLHAGRASSAASQAILAVSRRGPAAPTAPQRGEEQESETRPSRGAAASPRACGRAPVMTSSERGRAGLRAARTIAVLTGTRFAFLGAIFVLILVLAPLTQRLAAGRRPDVHQKPPGETSEDASGCFGQVSRCPDPAGKPQGGYRSSAGQPSRRGKPQGGCPLHIDNDGGVPFDYALVTATLSGKRPALVGGTRPAPGDHESRAGRPRCRPYPGRACRGHR